MKSTSIATVRLHDLPDRCWARVEEVTIPLHRADRDLVLRLVELGFVPDERVCIVATGEPGREPLAVRLGGATFALRRHEASFILVEPEL